jgi:cellulose synthase/poly-beta-1,6-N-acetylglucosamine synthase-like glycosyltransferase
MIYEIFKVLGLLLQVILLVYLTFGTAYIFIFSVAGLLRLKHKKPSATGNHHIAVLIPGYKEDNVIVEAAEAAMKQDYPTDCFDVIVIADQFKPETIDKLNRIPVKVIEVSFEISTKSKALNKAMATLPDNLFEIAVVLDADNLMGKDFLAKINTAFNAGYFAIQGHRVAKNTNTTFAILDAASEEINNHIFRKGHRILGLSSSLIGSGMAFRYDYFKDLMKDIKAVGGFDKEIELTMLKAGKKIEYLEHAFIYDEKVQVTGVFVKQRRRWLSAQLHYARYFFESVKHLLMNGNTDYFDKALQMLLPPRVVLLGLLPVIFLLSIFFNPAPLTITWGIILTMCILAILLAVPGNLYTIKTLQAVLSLPKGFLLMLFSLFSTKGANKKFIHTEHTSTNTSSSTSTTKQR